MNPITQNNNQSTLQLQTNCILENILSFLDVKSILKASFCCRSFHKASLKERLWIPFVEKFFYFNTLNKANSWRKIAIDVTKQKIGWDKQKSNEFTLVRINDSFLNICECFDNNGMDWLSLIRKGRVVFNQNFVAHLCYSYKVESWDMLGPRRLYSYEFKESFFPIYFNGTEIICISPKSAEKNIKLFKYVNLKTSKRISFIIVDEELEISFDYKNFNFQNNHIIFKSTKREVIYFIQTPENNSVINLKYSLRLIGNSFTCHSSTLMVSSIISDRIVTYHLQSKKMSRVDTPYVKNLKDMKIVQKFLIQLTDSYLISYQVCEKKWTRVWKKKISHGDSIIPSIDNSILFTVQGIFESSIIYRIFDAFSGKMVHHIQTCIHSIPSCIFLRFSSLLYIDKKENGDYSLKMKEFTTDIIFKADYQVISGFFTEYFQLLTV